jgi:hypothetical protein
MYGRGSLLTLGKNTMNIQKLLESQVANQATAFNIRTITPEFPKIEPYIPAKHTYERLISYINTFEADLDQEHEIGARLVSFGADIKFHIESISYWGPDIITFNGETSAGEKVQLIQNISQLSVLLIAMKKMHPKPRRIGFVQDTETKQKDKEEA